MVKLTPSEKRNLIEALRDDYSVHQICEMLSFHRRLLHYLPKSDPSQAVLEDKIEQLCGRYPTYGYRCIRQLLLCLGYTVRIDTLSTILNALGCRLLIEPIADTDHRFKPNCKEGTDVNTAVQEGVDQAVEPHLS